MENLRQKIYDADTNKVLRDEKFEPKKKGQYNPHYLLVFYTHFIKNNKMLNPLVMLILGQMKNNNRAEIDESKINTLVSNYKDVTANKVRITVSRMCKTDLMTRLEPGLYFINPYYATKANIKVLGTLRREYQEYRYKYTQNKNIKLEKKNKLLRAEVKQEKAGNEIIKNVNEIINNQVG